VKNVRDEDGAVAASAAGGSDLPATCGEAHSDHVAGEHHNTRQRVARAILENGPSTAASLAKGLRLTPAAVRRHLDALLAEGLIVASDRRAPGRRGRGRPAKVFALTDAGRGAFDQSYDELAINALAYLAERLGPHAVAEFARNRVAKLERAYAAVVAEAEPAARAEALARALSADGYAAAARQAAGGGEQLCQHHCPVAHVAARFPQLCEAETEVFARLLGTHVQRLATIAHGDGVCTTHVPSPNARKDSTRETRASTTQTGTTRNIDTPPIPASGRNTA
jgi:predicted ArsR family transcriptional regulator